MCSNFFECFIAGTQEEAAEAYDIAAIKFRGVNAVTNFDISRYDVEKIMASNTLPTGEIAKRNKEGKHSAEAMVGECHATPTPTPTPQRGVACDWKMVVHNEALAPTPGHQDGSLNLGNYQNPAFSVGLHDLIGLDSSQAVVDEPTTTMAPAHFSNASSLVTSLSSSREASPEKYPFARPNELAARFMSPSASGNVSGWIPTSSQLRPVQLTTAHLPVFAAWNDA